MGFQIVVTSGVADSRVVRGSYTEIYVVFGGHILRPLVDARGEKAWDPIFFKSQIGNHNVLK